VLVEPTSGGCPKVDARACPPVCWACWVAEIREVGKCPTCGHSVTDQSKLQLLEHSQRMIEKLRMRCKHQARRVFALKTKPTPSTLNPKP